MSKKLTYSLLTGLNTAIIAIFGATQNIKYPPIHIEPRGWGIIICFLANLYLIYCSHKLNLRSALLKFAVSPYFEFQEYTQQYQLYFIPVDNKGDFEATECKVRI